MTEYQKTESGGKTMTEHTPGPWHVSDPIDGRDIPYGIDDAKGHHLADVSDNHYGNPLPVEANARLIAAAPDLLAALEAMERRISTFGNPSHFDWSHDSNDRAMVNQARAAVAKAQGKEHHDPEAT